MITFKKLLFMIGRQPHSMKMRLNTLDQGTEDRKESTCYD